MTERPLSALEYAALKAKLLQDVRSLKPHVFIKQTEEFALKYGTANVVLAMKELTKVVR